MVAFSHLSRSEKWIWPPVCIPMSILQNLWRTLNRFQIKRNWRFKIDYQKMLFFPSEVFPQQILLCIHESNTKLTANWFWFLNFFPKKIIFQNNLITKNFDFSSLMWVFPLPRNGFWILKFFSLRKKYTTYIHDWIQLFPKQMGFLTWIFLPQENNTYQNWIF